MKKQVLLSNNLLNANERITMQNSAISNINATTIMKKAITMFNKGVSHVSRYYSEVVGEKLNNKQTLLIMNAQTAFFLTVFPATCPMYMRIICLAWLITALIQCKNSGIRTSD